MNYALNTKLTIRDVRTTISKHAKNYNLDPETVLDQLNRGVPVSGVFTMRVFLLKDSGMTLRPPVPFKQRKLFTRTENQEYGGVGISEDNFKEHLRNSGWAL